MIHERVGQGLRAGVVAAAATLGVLIGFGQARGMPLQPLNAIAHSLLGSRVYFITDFDWVVTLSALALHLVALIALAVVFAMIAGRLTGPRLVLAALVYAGVAYLAGSFVLPARITPGFERALSAPEVGAIYVVLAIALAAGVRLSVRADARVT